MSTRSGRRIHSSFHDNTVKAEDPASKSEWKTRRKRHKENDVDVVDPNSKKRPNYVIYPSEDNEATHEGTDIKTTRKSQKNTLKERNSVPATMKVDLAETKIIPRLTRQTRKFNEVEAVETHIQDEPNVRKSKKDKKKKVTKLNINEDASGEPGKEPMEEEVRVETNKSKKRNKKKNHKREEVKTSVNYVENHVNVSTDSFHSAARSPLTDDQISDPSEDQAKISKNYTHLIKSASPDTISQNQSQKLSVTKGETFKSYEKVSETPHSFIKNGSPSKSNQNISKLNNTFEMSPRTSETVIKGSEKQHSNAVKTNSPSESADHISVLNGTFDVSPRNSGSRVGTLDTTFDKSEPKLNTTFDKTDSNKSSIISSDRETLNVTFDKSNSSHISLTSDDDSKLGNITNTTPVLIESSIDESKASINNSTRVSLQKTVKNISKTVSSHSTSLIREGTFTKDSTETQTVSAPGSTPYRLSHKKSSEDNRSILNLTRSLEKSTRRSVLSEVPLIQTRQTRVMFCSPIDSPIVEVQKKHIIKSSMKGSNKSFVFEESDKPRPGLRKRSLTMSVSESNAKRPRADLTRQRSNTSTGAAALPPRTALPNFAALHRKRFAKMESLDECQQRKAKRAKELLTPLTPGKPKDSPTVPPKPANDIKTSAAPATPKRIPLVTLESLRPGFTRFGFKMQSDVNPFPPLNKPETKQTRAKATKAVPSSYGNAAVARKEAARQKVMRERVSNREQTRTENRTYIKGVRTNRRFELQMQMRNLD